ncbi:uncharacterized protein PAC_03286 [Phialocephala subalpina]|uniref:Zn(2)-C6 fungal-type domain-containing protein n=1 Tax=Phialocephala subalpina TaxID=576137 RepID=A0A1L7WKW2_9HELO|nr:uncharacterized protein PAC_03286 [Phialocephala subalpina]
MASTMKTRQKSCIACANSKRRCDRRIPYCSQCAAKFIPCEYKAAPQRTSKTMAEDSLPSSETFQDTPMVSGIELIHLQTTSLPPFSGTSSLFQVSGSDFNQQPNSLTDTDESFLDMYDMQLFNHPLPRIGTMDRPRTAYLIKTLRSYPSLLLSTTRTPFIHPFLFSPTIPSPLQDTIAACSLYLSKNETNEAVVWEIISSMVGKLLHSRRGGGGSWSVNEHLAAVQALVMFQIIRLFDGDVRARGDGEEVEGVLEEWTDGLALRTGLVAEAQEQPSPDARSLVEKGWESWVFEESVKRTVIVSRMVIAMYSVLKRGFCTYVEKVTELSFTARKELWEASSAVHWSLAVEAQERFYVQQMELGEVLGKARLEDVDELGLLMLVTYKGVDGVNEWIVRMGSRALIG